MLLVVIGAIIETLWPVLLGAGMLTLVALVLTKDSRAARRAATCQHEAEELQRWLDSPPPTLFVPARFSEQRFAGSVPRLHPAQVPALVAEMKARG